jgi:predicted site-specific integrase-resolvase
MNEEDKEDLLRPEEVVRILKVTNQTLINWDKQGLISSIRTKGNHRRYKRSDINRLANKQNQSIDRRKICYCRVSSPSQKEDLERQVEFFRRTYPHHDIITDIGSGLNYKRKGFNSILDLAIQGHLEEIMVTHKDRLCRFGFEFYERIIHDYSNGKIVVLNQKETSPTDELTNDLISIITVFSSRLYGLRSHKLKSKIKREATKDLEDTSLSD